MSLLLLLRTHSVVPGGATTAPRHTAGAVMTFIRRFFSIRHTRH